jgi:membrane protein
MQLVNRRALAHVAAHPLAFFLQTIKGFRANQGLLLAGAVAYYSLLSIVPLVMLMVVALSYFVEQAELLQAAGRYLEWLVPGQSTAIVAEVGHFLENRDAVGGVLLVSMLFFSSLAFTVLENAMCVIFMHRVMVKRRHYLISAFLPYIYILSLGVGMLLITLVAGALQVLGEEELHFLGRTWSLLGTSGVLLYLLGFAGEVLVLTSIYLVMPVGRLLLSHALIGGVTTALLWEVARRLLVWYFSTLSQINVVYGSLTTAIVVLFSFEIAATLLLYGAQVISDFERVGRVHPVVKPEPMTTDPAST